MDDRAPQEDLSHPPQACSPEVTADRVPKTTQESSAQNSSVLGQLLFLQMLSFLTILQPVLSNDYCAPLRRQHLIRATCGRLGHVFTITNIAAEKMPACLSLHICKGKL